LHGREEASPAGHIDERKHTSALLVIKRILHRDAFYIFENSETI
jgi:hypothetical protein